MVLLRGGRLAGPEPQGGIRPDKPLAPATVVEVDRKATKDGEVSLGQTPVALGSGLAGKQVTLRFDGSLMYVIHAGVLVQTLPAPIPLQRRAKLTGARVSTTPLPPPPSQPRRAIRRVGADGTFAVAGQKLRPGVAHAGKTVTVVIEETCFRVLDGDVEISTTPEKAVPSPATSPTPADRQASPGTVSHLLNRTCGSYRHPSVSLWRTSRRGPQDPPANTTSPAAPSTMTGAASVPGTAGTGNPTAANASPPGTPLPSTRRASHTLSATATTGPTGNSHAVQPRCTPTTRCCGSRPTPTASRTGTSPTACAWRLPGLS
ncbi:hypothetical protein BX265_0675 [Streptomyces sp. TLI_235]|nr:hypothetical protein BX265_0675 [Streptomyces sp. TLI_235]